MSPFLSAQGTSPQLTLTEEKLNVEMLTDLGGEPGSIEISAQIINHTMINHSVC